MRDRKREFAAHFGCSPFKSAVLQPSVALALAVPAVAILILLCVMAADSGGSEVLLAFTPSAFLVRTRKELTGLQKSADRFWEEAGPDLNVEQITRFGDEDISGLSTDKKLAKATAAGEKLNHLNQQAVREVERIDGGKSPSGMRHPDPGGPGFDTGAKAVEALWNEDRGFKAWNQSGRPNSYGNEYDQLPSKMFKLGRQNLKTLFATTAGWVPESTRIGRIVDEPTRSLQLTDVIPFIRTGQASVVYMEETTRTHSSAETSEGTAYPESQFVLTEQTSTVRKIADSIPVTDEQLADVPEAQGYLSNRLEFGVRQRLDGQILTGDGAAPNLTGILNVAGIQTQAKGGDPTPDAILKAANLVRVTGRANPDTVVLHPNDWESIRLLKTADGIYLWGPPSEKGPLNIFGLRVVLTDAITENTGLVGDFANFCAVFERAGVNVEVGFVGTQFSEGEKTLRAQMRAAFVTFRPSGFATITGI